MTRHLSPPAAETRGHGCHLALLRCSKGGRILFPTEGPGEGGLNDLMVY